MLVLLIAGAGAGAVQRLRVQARKAQVRRMWCGSRSVSLYEAGAGEVKSSGGE